MMPYALDSVRKGLQRLEDAVENRGEPFDSEWTFLSRRIRRALSALEQYVASEEVFDVDLAEVLCDYVRTGIDRLRRLIIEMDGRYRDGGA